MALPNRYLIDTDKLSLQVTSLLHGNDTQFIGVVKRNSDEKGRAQIYNRSVQ